MPDAAFTGWTWNWQRPGLPDWPVWVCARTRRESGICAMVTFALLEAQQAERP